VLWPDDERPVIHNRQVRVQIQERGEITPYGGLALAHDLAMRLGIDRDINRSMKLLRLYLPYFDSDHLLTHVYNQYVGGSCIEDMAKSGSSGVRGVGGARGVGSLFVTAACRMGYDEEFAAKRCEGSAAPCQSRRAEITCGQVDRGLVAFVPRPRGLLE